MRKFWYRARLKALPTVLLAVMLGAALVAGLRALPLENLEAISYDLRIRLSAYAPSTDDLPLVLIRVDDSALNALNELSPLSMSVHAKIFETLERSEPRSIGYLLDFPQLKTVSPSSEDSERGGAVHRLLQSTARLSAAHVPIWIGTNFDPSGEVVPPYPLSTLPHAIRVLHRDGYVFSENGMVRRAWIKLFGQNTFHEELIESMGREPHLTKYDDSNVGGEYIYIGYRKNNFEEYSVLDLLNEKIPAEKLKNKTILVGSTHWGNPHDFALTPIKREIESTSLVVHAEILNALWNSQSIVVVKDTLNFAILIFSVALSLVAVVLAPPLQSTALVAAYLLIFTGLNTLAFLLTSHWFEFVRPVLGSLLAFYIVAPFRLIQEHHRRWNYQRRNDLLSQVEEMKTNFLRLVTHDLKTPIARIQGLSELLLKKQQPTPTLVPEFRPSLEQILKSSFELNSFVNSLLELTRLESGRIELRKESVDPNRLLEKVVKRFQESADAKNIKIELILEPQFPIALDRDLIEKVMANLIDNAIKYSPNDSKIEVETADHGDWVEISIRDQGIGMSPEDLQNIFKRFYRSKNTRDSKMSGTGLGLYLTKYFTEAHGGQVLVESELNKGSVFKIHLPVHSLPGLTTVYATTEGEKYESRTRR